MLTEFKMKKIIFIIILFIKCSLGLGQVTPNYLNHLPKGFELTDSRIESDFDGDGIGDLAIILTNTNSIPNLFIFLSSNFNKDKSYQFCEWGLMVHSFFYENDILILISTAGGASAMTVNDSIKLKYEYKKMVVIEGDVTLLISANQ